MLRLGKRCRGILAYRQTDHTIVESRLMPNASDPGARQPGPSQQSASTLEVSAAVRRWYLQDDAFESRICRLSSVRSSPPQTPSRPVLHYKSNQIPSGNDPCTRKES